MKNHKEYDTDFLLPVANFLTGMGSIFNFAGNYYSFNTSKTGSEADRKAISSDWRMVGKDFKNVLSEHEIK
jgi:hypothetical protein